MRSIPWRIEAVSFWIATIVVASLTGALARVFVRERYAHGHSTLGFCERLLACLCVRLSYLRQILLPNLLLLELAAFCAQGFIRSDCLVLLAHVGGPPVAFPP